MRGGGREWRWRCRRSARGVARSRFISRVMIRNGGWGVENVEEQQDVWGHMKHRGRVYCRGR